jgi:hypothetical protein
MWIHGGSGARSRHDRSRGHSGVDVDGSRTDLPEHVVAFFCRRQLLELTRQLPQPADSIGPAHALLAIFDGGPSAPLRAARSARVTR